MNMADRAAWTSVVVSIASLAVSIAAWNVASKAEERQQRESDQAVAKDVILYFDRGSGASLENRSKYPINIVQLVIGIEAGPASGPVETEILSASEEEILKPCESKIVEFIEAGDAWLSSLSVTYSDPDGRVWRRNAGKAVVAVSPGTESTIETQDTIESTTRPIANCGG